MQSLLNWLDHRTGYRHLLNEALYEPVPGGARWRYVWGSTLVFTFVIQVITGMSLWMAYSPGATSAWESVFFIQKEMTLGWFIRGMHHFTAQAMVILLLLHLMQVVIDGAYKAPREVNFWLGLILMQIVLFLGLTGYLLPWDQKGYYATRVATNIAGSAPVVGGAVQQLIQGGKEYGHHTLTRFFMYHAGLLPAALVGFLALHIYVFRRHRLHAVIRPGAKDGMFWPDQVLKDGVACLAVLAAILFANFWWGGAELSAPANPAQPYDAARPEWYYLFLFKFLQFPLVSQIGEATHLGEAFGAIVVPGILMTVIILMPFIGRTRMGHYFNVAYLWSVIGIAGVLTAIAVRDDWYADTDDGRSFRAAVAQSHKDAERVIELAMSPTGIPPAGASGLLASDPLTQGPVLFAAKCRDCHQPDGGQGVAPTLTKSDTGEVIFGKREEWIKQVLTGFGRHFAPLANMKGESATAANKILAGQMRDWSDTHGPKLSQAENAADLVGIQEFLYAQSRRPDSLKPDDPKVLRGKAIFETGKLTVGEVDACLDCHAMRPLGIRGEVIALEEEPISKDLFPVLTNYGGVDWLKAFIANPQAHYAGDSGNNAMPAFADQLSPHELDMLARWLAGDYYVAPKSE